MARTTLEHDAMTITKINNLRAAVAELCRDYHVHCSDRVSHGHDPALDDFKQAVIESAVNILLK